MHCQYHVHADRFMCLQTGSGKSYTLGTGSSGIPGCLDHEIGLLPRVSQYLFNRLRDPVVKRASFSVSVEFIEVRGMEQEHIFDLLDSSAAPIEIEETKDGDAHVVGCRREPVHPPPF